MRIIFIPYYNGPIASSCSLTSLKLSLLLIHFAHFIRVLAIGLRGSRTLVLMLLLENLPIFYLILVIFNLSYLILHIILQTLLTSFIKEQHLRRYFGHILKGPVFPNLFVVSCWQSLPKLIKETKGLYHIYVNRIPLTCLCSYLFILFTFWWMRYDLIALEKSLWCIKVEGIPSLWVGSKNLGCGSFLEGFFSFILFHLPRFIRIGFQWADA